MRTSDGSRRRGHRPRATTIRSIGIVEAAKLGERTAESAGRGAHSHKHQRIQTFEVRGATDDGRGARMVGRTNLDRQRNPSPPLVDLSTLGSYREVHTYQLVHVGVVELISYVLGHCVSFSGEI